MRQRRNVPKASWYRVASAFWLGLFGLGLWLAPAHVAAQNPFPEVVEEFPVDFQTRLKATKTSFAEEYLKTFQADWNGTTLSPGEQMWVIKQCNRLLKRRYTITDIAVYLRTVLNIRSDLPKIRIPVTEFIAVTDSASLRNKPAEVVTFFRLIQAIVPNGNLFETPTARWTVSQQVPKLQYIINRVTDSLTGTSKVTSFPALIFSNTNLSFISKTDSSVVYDVKGYVNLTNKIFYIDKARYTWMRLKQDPNDLYVELKDFQIRLTALLFKCDSAVLHYNSFLNRPLRGTFVENLIPQPNPEKADFPQFRSLEGGLRIENFIPSIAYEGGFSLRGLTKYGSRTETEFATLHIYNKDQREVLKLQANEFALNPQRLLTPTARMTLYLSGTDSLTHPSMGLSYDVERRLMALKLNRKDPLSRQPIRDSYHKYNLYFEAIEWVVGTDTLHFKAFIDQENKYFAIESQSFFRMDRYMQFKGVLAFHPMTLLHEYSVERPFEPRIPLESFKKRFKLVEDSDMAITAALIDLQGSGYVKWDPTFQTIEVTDRLRDWAKAARNFGDYDAIQILSNVNNDDNAQLNYSTGLMEMRGVRTFTLSDSQLVVIKPQADKVFIKRNRDLDFGGRVYAGKVNFFSNGFKKFQFQYEPFKIYCDSIDSLKFVPKRDPTFNYDRFKNKTLLKALEKLKIEGVKGAIYINRNTNRSGKAKSKEYPVFDCYTISFVYWADKNIQGGVYSKDLLKFKMDPFLLDSLERFNIEKLAFTGEFNTDDIFPTFVDTLMPVADNTYGIREKVPKEGVPLYKGKGKFFDVVNMDSYGLWGDGQIEYLSSTADADTFVFHPDSVMGITNSYEIKPGNLNGTNFPQMKAGKIKFKWYPYEDRQVLGTDKEPISLFNGQAEFRGEMVLTPGGLKAKGSLTVGQLQVTSESFNFTENEWSADSGDFKIASPDNPNVYHVTARRMKLQYDMKTMKSKFQSLTIGEPDLTFNQNKFSTSLGLGEYDSKTGTVGLRNKVGYKSANYFRASDSAMHGLQFPAMTANYNIGTNELKVTGADTVAVADAYILPSNAEMTIRKAGKIDTLAEALVLAQQVGQYHNLFNATVQIINGIDYKASTNYSYTGLKNLFQTFTFQAVTVRKEDTTTVAVATIDEGMNFFVTERIFFRGKIELDANQRFLHFKGQVKLQSSNDLLKDSWFELDDVVNPDSIFIRITKEKLRDLTAGVHYMPLYRRFYNNFLARRKMPTRDQDVLLATGTEAPAPGAENVPVQQAGLGRDQTTGEFLLGPQGKLKGSGQYQGNVVAYDDTSRTITARGFIKFPYHQPANTGGAIKMAGSWREDQKKNVLTTNLVVSLEFPILPKTIIDKLGERLIADAGLNEEIDFTQRPLQEALSEIIDNQLSLEENIKRLVLDVQTATQVNQIKVNKYYQSMLMLSGVKLNWNDSLKAFHHFGPVGVVYAGGTTVNRLMNARIDYRIGRVLPNGKYFDDTLRVLLEPDEANWIMFEYTGYKLRVGSSYDSYNRLVNSEGIKIAARRKAPDDGMTLEELKIEEKEIFQGEFARRYLFTAKKKKATDP